jgi:SAM-dependent methyltransferase
MGMSMLKPNLKPDDICTCGSRRRYADCHMPIYAAPRGKAVDVAHQIYAQEWTVNADHYASQGLYKTLATELAASGEVRRVLDVGCGAGQGLEALSSVVTGGDRLIAGIDENPDCLAAAAQRLGLAAAAVAGQRVKSQLGLKLYDSVPERSPIAVHGDRVLVQADVLTLDPSFESWLRAAGPFDAITLWFTGGHKARSETKVAQRIEARDDEDFRWSIEDRVIEIAVRHLKAGGLVQIVTRAAGDPETWRRETEVQRREAIADYPFDVVSVAAYPYDEPQSAESIVMASAAGAQVAGQRIALSTLLRANALSTEAATEGLLRLARRTPFNIAPERAAELAEEVFGTGDWTISPRAFKADFRAIVSEKAIVVSWAGLASLWCVAYVAYAVMQLGSLASRAPGAKGASGIDFGQQWFELNLDGYVDFAKRLIHKDEPWPIGITAPDAKPSDGSHENKINNLFFGALSWILLHEIGHVRHDHDETLPADQMRRQERQADDFATSWVLDDTGSGLSREFRVLMVVTALAWLFVFEAAGGQGASHPPVIQRFRDAAAKFDLGERSPALENASYLLKAMFDPAGPPAPKRRTPREAFDWMAKRLEQLFPAR